MQVILDSSFARPSSAPIWDGKKGEFRDWTKRIALLVKTPLHENREVARSGNWDPELIILLYIVFTISILIGQEPPGYFENSRDFVDKHDYSIICYPIICADYTVRSAHCAP